MTVGYNATEWGSYLKFWGEIAPLIIKNHEFDFVERRKEVYNFIKDFYQFLQTDLFTTLFITDRQLCLKALDMENIKINSFNLNFTYNKEKNIEVRDVFKNKGKR